MDGLDPRTLEAARDVVLRDMARMGFPIHARVHIAMRPGLRAMATTFATSDGYGIIVSDRARDIGPLETLLAHELSHVYRMDSKHPSHDDDAITAAYASLPEWAQEHDYQRAFLHHVINLTQDLYAGPISFRVMRDIKALDEAALDDMLLGFLTDDPFVIEDEREHRWDVAHDMVSNARGITLIKRAGTPAALVRAEAIQARLLAMIPQDIAQHAAWFQELFDTLPEGTTRESFTATLIEYANRFARIAEGHGV